MVHRGSDEKWISNKGFTGVGNLFVCCRSGRKEYIHGTTRRELDAVKKKEEGGGGGGGRRAKPRDKMLGERSYRMHEDTALRREQPQGIKTNLLDLRNGTRHLVCPRQHDVIAQSTLHILKYIHTYNRGRTQLRPSNDPRHRRVLA